MAGNATLGGSLVDSLVEVVDGLRDALHPAFGVRQYRAFVVTRTWDGGRIGDGLATDEEIEIEPRPRCREPGDGYRLDHAGRAEAFDLVLEEVSLTYTEAELGGGTIAAGVEVFWRIEDAEGQEIAPRFFVLAAPPTPDRESSIGWSCKLRRVRREASDAPPEPEDP